MRTRLLGFAMRRKGTVAMAILLTFAVAGTALAAARGTTLKMGVTQILTGNYVTTYAGTVTSALLYLKNSSTASTSSGLRIDTPNGGNPLDLRAKAGFAPMRVNSATKVTNLNADKIDGIDSTAFGRAAFGRSTTYVALSTTDANLAAATINVPGPAGGTSFIKVDAAAHGYLSTTDANSARLRITVSRYQGATLMETTVGNYETLAPNSSVNPNGTAALSWVFAVPTGTTQTFRLAAANDWGTGSLQGMGSISALYVPFGSTGGGTLGTTSSGSVKTPTANQP
jgi:hypothetical protein